MGQSWTGIIIRLEISQRAFFAWRDRISRDRLEIYRGKSFFGPIVIAKSGRLRQLFTSGNPEGRQRFNGLPGFH
jgi:hypothetical protein